MNVKVNQQDAFGEMLRFGTVGLTSTVIDFATLNLLDYVHTNTYLAVFLAYLLGSINGYILNNNWTYRHLERKVNFINFGQYAVISFIGLGLTELIIYSLTENVHLGINDNLALNAYKAVSVIIVFFWNFFANRALTFKPA